MSLHCEDITLTYWSDANSVVFMDNDVPNILEWDTIERRCRGGEIQVVRVPLVGSIYQNVIIVNDLQSFFGWKFTIHLMIQVSLLSLV